MKTDPIVNDIFGELIKAAVVARDEAEDAADFRERIRHHIGESSVQPRGVILMPPLDNDDAEDEARP